MAYIGTKPADKPLTSADITDGIIVNADIANSTINLTTKVTGSLPVANGGTGLTALGSSLQVLRTNTGATALEFATISTGANAGEVIQVVNATDSTERATSSTSFVTGANTLSVSITPSATANKILILASSSGYTGGDNTAYYTLYRGATNLGSTDGITMLKSTGGYGNIGFMVYDSPSTTSSTTYQVYMRGDGGANVRLNYGQGTATKGFITALEIKG